jgi:hypothetical protein
MRLEGRFSGQGPRDQDFTLAQGLRTTGWWAYAPRKHDLAALRHYVTDRFEMVVRRFGEIDGSLDLSRPGRSAGRNRGSENYHPARSRIRR